jgi:hypothetical protein
MLDIAPDERRSQAAKVTPPLRGRPEKRAGGVARLARAASPLSALILPSPLLRPIAIVVGAGFTPWVDISAQRTYVPRRNS